MADEDDICSSPSFKSAFAAISSGLVSSVQRLRSGSGDIDEIETQVQQLQGLEKRQRDDISSMIRSSLGSAVRSINEDQLAARSAELLAYAEDIQSKMESVEIGRSQTDNQSGLWQVANALTARVETLEMNKMSPGRLLEYANTLTARVERLEMNKMSPGRLLEYANTLEARVEALESLANEHGTLQFQELVLELQRLKDGMRSTENDRDKLAEVARSLEMRAERLQRRKEEEPETNLEGGASDANSARDIEQLHDRLLARVEALEVERIRATTILKEQEISKSLDMNDANYEALQNRLAACELEKSRLGSELAGYKGVEGKRSQEFLQMQDAIGNQQLKDMEDRLATQVLEHSRLMSELQIERETRSQLEESMQSKKSQVASLHKELSGLRQTVSTFEAERNAPSNILNNVDDVIDINAERRKSAQLEIFLDELKSTLDHQTVASSEREKELDDYKAKYEDLIRSLSAEREKTQRLQASHSDALNAADERGELRKQLSRASQDLDETVKKYNMTRERLSVSEEESERLKADLDARTQRISELDESAKRMSADRELYRDTVTVTQQETEDMRRRIEELTREKELLGIQSQSLLEKERIQTKSFDKARNEADNLRTRLAQFENLLQDRTEEFERLQTELKRELEAQREKSSNPQASQESAQRYEILEAELKREIEAERLVIRELRASKADEVKRYTEMLAAERNSRFALEEKCSEWEAKCSELSARIYSTSPQKPNAVRLDTTSPATPEKAVEAVPLEQALEAQTIAKLRLRLARPHATLDQQALQDMLQRIQGEQVCLQTAVQGLLRDVQGLRQSSQEFFTSASTSKNELSQAVLKNSKMEEDVVNLKLSVASKQEDCRLLEEEKHRLGVQYEVLRASTVSKEEYLRVKGALESDWHHYAPTRDGVSSSRSFVKFGADAQQFTISTPGRSRSPVSPRTSPPPEQRMVIPGAAKVGTVRPPQFLSRSSSSAGTMASPLTLSPTEVSVPQVSLGSSSAPMPGMPRFSGGPVRRPSDGLVRPSPSHLVPAVPLGTSSVPEPGRPRPSSPAHLRQSSPAHLRPSGGNPFVDRGAFLPPSARTAQAAPSRLPSGGGFNHTQIPVIPGFAVPTSAPPTNELFRMSFEPNKEAQLFMATVMGTHPDSRRSRQTVLSNRPVTVTRDPTTR